MYVLVVLLLIASMATSFDYSGYMPWLNPYLVEHTKPIHYDLLIQPHIWKRTFDGEVSIEIKVSLDTNFIIVHAKLLSIYSTEVLLNNTRLEGINAFEYKNHSYWVVETEKYFESGKTVQLRMKFTGVMSRAEGIAEIGFYNDEVTKYSPLVITTFKPTFARMCFPNYDDPFYKAHFTIRLRHWSNLTAVSNMPEDTVTDIDGIWRETKFKKTPLISSFAVGFIISDYVSRNNTLSDGKLHRVWARPKEVHGVEYALKATEIVNGFLNRELGIITLLPKIDQFAIRHMIRRGAHSHWGLINHVEERLAFNSTLVGDEHRQTSLVVIATALAHNYFGLLVTCQFWNHVWLHSSLARFYGLKAAAAFEPISFEAYGLKELGLHDDALENSSPLVPHKSLIHTSVNTNSDQDFRHPLMLSKGVALFTMMENFLGADAFNRGIREYIQKYQLKKTVTGKLFDELQSVANASRLPTHMVDIMKTWVYSMGYPVITIRLLSDKRISATQRRFLMDPMANPNSPSNSHGYKWYVPLNYRTKGDNTGRVWMNKSTNAIFHNLLNAGDNWILFNHDRSGYYRVNYERPLWYNIIKQLKIDHTVFTDLERSQLLSDALNVAKAEQLEFDVALDLTMYASKERSLSSWIHIYNALENIHLMLANTSDYPSYQRYVLNLTTDVMNELKVVDEGTVEQKLLRQKIISLSCSAGHRGCIENTTRLFKAWIQNEKLNVVPVNIRRLVYCHGIANSSHESEWNATIERFFATSHEHLNKEILLSGMTCTKNLTLLHRLLEKYFSNHTVVRLWFPYLEKAAKGFSSNSAASGYFWEWLKVNRDQVDARLYAGGSAYVAYEITRSFNTMAQLQEVRHNFDDMHTIKQAEWAITKMDERIKGNIRWMYKQHATVSMWLQKNFPI